MKTFMRVLVATIIGALFGVVCFLGYQAKMGVPLGAAMIAGIIANRALIGFAIGLSKIKNWFWNGLIFGLAVSLSYSIHALVAGDWIGFLAFTGGGIVYGILIELITSLLFKMKA